MQVPPFSSMGTAFSGLQAAQAALDITSQNIASVGMEGYSRQRIEQTGARQSTNSWYVGSPGGVEVVGYQRLRDELLDRRYYDQAPLQGDSDTRASILGQVEIGFAEPSDHGLQNLIDKFFLSWQGAANAPTSTPSRQAVIDSASSLVQGFNQTSQMLSTTLTQIANEQNVHLGEVVRMTDQIAGLTNNIRATLLQGGSANSLMDQRDMILDKLAVLGNISVTKYDDGNIKVSFGAFDLITADTGAPVANTPSLVDLNTASAGTMYALRELSDSDPSVGVISGLQSKLDSIASQIAQLVNTQHKLGYDLSGNAGLDFFSGTTANSIQINTAIQSSPGLLALSSSATAKGDNSNALLLTALVDQANTVGTESINGAYGSLVSQVGTLVSQANNQSKIQTSMTNSVKDQRDSVSGVSLDEEMSNLIRYQQSYSAAARVISALDQMLEILVTRVGKVGL